MVLDNEGIRERRVSLAPFISCAAVSESGEFGITASGQSPLTKLQ